MAKEMLKEEKETDSEVLSGTIVDVDAIIERVVKAEDCPITNVSLLGIALLLSSPLLKCLVLHHKCRSPSSRKTWPKSSALFVSG